METRTFIKSKHLIPLSDAAWCALVDEYHHTLTGIRGKALACGNSQGGDEIGVDLIEMESGSAFPPHVHAGDHLLYVLEGRGCVSIDGTSYRVKSGDSIYIAAEYPHAVSAPSAAVSFLAFGYPHKPIESAERMKIVDSLFECQEASDAEATA